MFAQFDLWRSNWFASMDMDMDIQGELDGGVQGGLEGNYGPPPPYPAEYSQFSDVNYLFQVDNFPLAPLISVPGR